MHNLLVRFPLLLVAAIVLVLSPGYSPAAPPYRSPFDVAFSPDWKTLAVSDRTAGTLSILDVAEGKVLREVALRGEPHGVAWSPDGSSVFVAEYGAATAAEVDPKAGQVIRRLSVGLRPAGVAVAARRGLLVATNTVTDDVSIVDLSGGTEKARIRVPREPYFAAVSPDESVALVGNLLPAGSAADPGLSAALSIIDLEKLACIENVRLPPGSTGVRSVAISPDGKWGYAVHTVGRFNLPTTQLDRGWVNTNALSIIDLSAKRHFVTVLIDFLSQGAADPWGLALEPRALWVSLRGTHQLLRLDIQGLHRLLAGELSPDIEKAAAQPASAVRIWTEIKADPARRGELVNDLAALYAAGLLGRYPLPGNGPRGLRASPDGKLLAAALYFSGAVALVDAESGKVKARIPLGEAREPDLVRRGEILFHDATICFQHWMSCATCHPDEARTDGLRWDLLNDGIGTPQKTRSLLFSHKVFPTTSRGIRHGIKESVPKGVEFLMRKATPDLVDPLIAYLESLKPEPSPFLVDGKLSERAARGKALFDGKADCLRCHPGELGTDLKAYDVGTKESIYREGDLFFTPKLVELYRTAPFLHDASAATLLEVLTKYNASDKHGITSTLTPEELEDLVEYMKSI